MAETTDPFFEHDALTGRKSSAMIARLYHEAILLNEIDIAFTEVTKPHISFVIVSYNSQDLLCMTLVKLMQYQTTAVTSFEVIVVDNASNQGTRQLLERVRNANIIMNDENIGSGPACNIGAAEAKGKYLLFLNPDIQLLPGALDAMVDTYSKYSKVGIVGARLVFPSGLLQEAGAYFVDDEQLTHPYLRASADASAPEVLFMREVGYVSGAVMMIEKELFVTLNGFDPLFAPAYFEDADLCLRCAQLGHRIIYQPRATAIHFENATSPNRANVESLLNTNRERLRERHSKWLFESGTHPNGFMLRDTEIHRFRVLYIDDHVPHVDKGAGLPRANSIISNMVALGYFVTVLPIHSTDEEPAARYRDIDPRVEILRAGSDVAVRRILEERAGYYDLIWISRPHNIETVIRTFLEAGVSLRTWVKSRIIFDTEALFSAREAVFDLTRGIPIDLSLLSQAVLKETAYAPVADLIVCVSKGEQRLLERLGGVENTRILGHNIVAKEGQRSFEDRNGILFLGPMTEDGTPNVDSMDWFLKEAWPLVTKQIGDCARLVLVGNIAPDIRRRYEQANVEILGRVDELASVFDTVRVAIAPTRFAAGIPEKVHKCVSHGVPMVISPLLQTQIGWEQEVGCISEDWRKPRAFADAVVRLHEEKAFWSDVRQRGMSQIKTEFSTEAFRLTLRDICEDVFF